jgi:hypothetical protein
MKLTLTLLSLLTVATSSHEVRGVRSRSLKGGGKKGGKETEGGKPDKKDGKGGTMMGMEGKKDGGKKKDSDEKDDNNEKETGFAPCNKDGTSRFPFMGADSSERLLLREGVIDVIPKSLCGNKDGKNVILVV